MSRRIGNVVIICEEKPEKCDMCEKIKELRPYGPNGERICYECYMKDEETMYKIMCKVLFGK